MTAEIGCHLFYKQYLLKLYLNHTKLGAKWIALCVFVLRVSLIVL